MIMDGFGMSEDQLNRNRESLHRHAPHDMEADGEATQRLGDTFDDLVMNDVTDLPGDYEVQMNTPRGTSVHVPAFSCDAAVFLMYSCRLGCC